MRVSTCTHTHNTQHTHTACTHAHARTHTHNTQQTRSHTMHAHTHMHAHTGPGRSLDSALTSYMTFGSLSFSPM